MNNVLQRRVFVLNRLWQLINETSVEEAIKQMATDVATGLIIDPEGMHVPVKWEDWIQLPILREGEVIRTQHLQIRMPTVIIAVNFAKVPKRSAKFNLKNIARRDGFKDQYTGEILHNRADWSMDHVIPLSRGGADDPTNVVLTSKKLNNKKGNRLPEEIGLTRPKIRRLGAFQPLPSHPDHEHFIIKVQH